MRRLYNSDVGDQATTPEKPFANVSQIIGAMLLMTPSDEAKSLLSPLTINVER